MKFKEKLHQHCQQLLQEKTDLLQKLLADLKEAGASETKRTAGDKHETALAMVQIEQANKKAQLDELLSMKLAYRRINPTIQSNRVVTGSLIKTNRGYLFLSVALGKITVDNVIVIVLSPQSPLGAKLAGLQVGESAEIKGNCFLVESIE